MNLIKILIITFGSGFVQIPESYPDCGVVSLYHLLTIEGKGRAADSLLDKFGGHPRTRSLADLRDISAIYGLALDGIQLSRDRLPTDRPFIVFLDRASHGHFIVIRPIGPSGTLVQILDGDHSPEVVDLRAITGSAEWSGLGLVPRRRNWMGLATLALGVTFLVSAIAKVSMSRISRKMMERDS